MRLFVVSIFDSAVQVFGRPVFVPHTGASIRDFTNECRRVESGNVLNSNRSDFELHCLGTFDDSTGLFTTDGTALLARGADVPSLPLE